MDSHQGGTKTPRHRVTQTLEGTVIIGYLVEAVGLGQALMVMADNKVYHMAGLWDKMIKEECKGANEATFAGRQWIEQHPAVDLKAIDMKVLHGAASWCQHTGYLEHLGRCVREWRALMFGIKEQGEQMAEKIRVGAVGTVKQECNVCDQWKKYKGAGPKFRSDGSIYFIDQVTNRPSPDGTVPPEPSGPAAPPTTVSSMAPSPRSFRVSPSEFGSMEWCNLDDIEW